jgi:DNA-binding transcriptional ArsR family regulator
VAEDAESDGLDQILEALANPHRRSIVYTLGLAPCTIAYLAALRDLSLPAIHKHIKILEAAGLITRRKTGRSTYLTLNPAPLRQVQHWAGQFHTHWGSGEGTFENYRDHLGLTPGSKTKKPTSQEKTK